MCICLARYANEGVIIEEDITEAITQVTGLIYASAKAAAGGGLDPLAAQTKRVVEHLIAAPENQLLQRELLIKGYGDFDVGTLERIIETLVEMGWVRKEKVGIGKNMDWLLKLAGEPKESYMKFRALTNGKLK